MSTTYRDKFSPVTFVNEDDPEFIVGTSPAISAENLNAIETGISDALTGLDEEHDSNNSRLDRLEYTTDSALRLAYSGSISIQPSAWVYDAQHAIYKYTILNNAITSGSLIHIAPANNFKYEYSDIVALNPSDGAVVVTRGFQPNDTITLVIWVIEVRIPQ